MVGHWRGRSVRWGSIPMILAPAATVPDIDLVALLTRSLNRGRRERNGQPWVCRGGYGGMGVKPPPPPQRATVLIQQQASWLPPFNAARASNTSERKHHDQTRT